MLMLFLILIMLLYSDQIMAIGQGERTTTISLGYAGWRITAKAFSPLGVPRIVALLISKSEPTQMLPETSKRVSRGVPPGAVHKVWFLRLVATPRAGVVKDCTWWRHRESNPASLGRNQTATPVCTPVGNHITRQD